MQRPHARRPLLLHAHPILSSLELSDKSLDNVDRKGWKHVLMMPQTTYTLICSLSYILEKEI
jgi:hypothetical protein